MPAGHWIMAVLSLFKTKSAQISLALRPVILVETIWTFLLSASFRFSAVSSDCSPVFSFLKSLNKGLPLFQGGKPSLRLHFRRFLCGLFPYLQEMRQFQDIVDVELFVIHVPAGQAVFPLGEFVQI